MRRFLFSNRLWLLGLLSALVYAANFRAGELLVRWGVLVEAPHEIVSYLIQIAPLSLLYVLSLWFVARAAEKESKSLVPGILLFAFLFRLPLVPVAPTLSSDLYRYLWDGRVQVVGKTNSYLHPPADDRLASLRDEEIYPQINRKEAPTVYPAGAQILFRTLYRVGVDSPAEFKTVALVAEAMTLLFLLLILKERWLPRSWIAVYAWNPLVIYELSYSGHLESFMIPAVMGFVYLFRRRALTAGALLGMAASIKLLPALLLLAVPPGKRLKAALPFFAVLASAYLPYYAGSGAKILGFLPSYFSDPYEIFNPGLLQIALLRAAALFSIPFSSVRSVLFFCLLAASIFILRRSEGSRADLARRCTLLLSAYFLLIYPALHPWYLSALIPFLCLIPSRGWLYLSLALPLSYLKYLAPDGAMPGWVSLAQFIPLYILLALEYARIQPVNERRDEWCLGTQTSSSTTP